MIVFGIADNTSLSKNTLANKKSRDFYTYSHKYNKLKCMEFVT